MESFGTQLSNVRRAKGLTQEQLAERLAVSRTNISRWESGKLMPDIDTIKRLSQILEFKAPPHNSAARQAMSFPPSAARKFLDLPPVNLRNLHLHLTENPFAGRPPHLCGVALISSPWRG